jgi:hypothetical protein
MTAGVLHFFHARFEFRNVQFKRFAELKEVSFGTISSLGYQKACHDIARTCLDQLAQQSSVRHRACSIVESSRG